MTSNNQLFNTNPLYEPKFPKSSQIAPSAIQKPLLKTPSLTIQEEKINGIRPLLTRVGLFLASFATAPFPSLYRRVEFKRTHRSYAMNMAWQKAKYGNALVGLTRNLSKDEVQVRKKEKQAAEKLMEECKELLKNDEFSHLTLNQNEKFKPLKDDGICSGVRTYIAAALLHGNPIENVIKELDKGAPVKAAANQYANQATISKPQTGSQIFVNLIDHLTQLTSSPSNEKLKINPRAIQVALFLSDHDFRTTKFHESTKVATENLNEHEATFIRFIQSSVPENKTTIRDLEKFQQQVQQKINDHFDEQILKDTSSDNFKNQLQIRESYTESLKWTVSLLEMKNAYLYEKKSWLSIIKFRLSKGGSSAYAMSEITHPLHREVAKSSKNEESILARLQLVAAANGIKYSSLQETLGSSVLMKDDHSYLANLDKLAPGVYGINISTYRGLHAMFYKKNDDGSGYLIDPNGPQLFCTKQTAVALLEKVIGTYTDPKVKPTLAGPKDRHHQISFFHITKREKVATD